MAYLNKFWYLLLPRLSRGRLRVCLAWRSTRRQSGDLRWMPPGPHGERSRARRVDPAGKVLHLPCVQEERLTEGVFASIARGEDGLHRLSQPARCDHGLHARPADGQRHLLSVPRRKARSVPVGARPGRRGLHQLSRPAWNEPSRDADAQRAPALPELSFAERAPEHRPRRGRSGDRCAIAIPARPELPELSFTGAWLEPSVGFETDALK